MSVYKYISRAQICDVISILYFTRKKESCQNNSERLWIVMMENVRKILKTFVNLPCKNFSIDSITGGELTYIMFLL